jgi:hypothetical protein
VSHRGNTTDELTTCNSLVFSARQLFREEALIVVAGTGCEGRMASPGLVQLGHLRYAAELTAAKLCERFLSRLPCILCLLTGADLLMPSNP